MILCGDTAPKKGQINKVLWITTSIKANRLRRITSYTNKGKSPLARRILLLEMLVALRMEKIMWFGDKKTKINSRGGIRKITILRGHLQDN
jgi:hypothetical protein